ncbi:hypothetical protein P9112_010765 [Eukaryota sp. TZLM1-RC]
MFSDTEHPSYERLPASYFPSNMRLRVHPLPTDSKHPPWSSVKEVVLVTSSPIHCPICLEEPLAAFISNCGHYACLPCLLKLVFFENQTFDSYDSILTSCVVCKKYYHFHDIRPLLIHYADPITIGSELDFILCSSNSNSSLASFFCPLDPSITEIFLYDRVTPFYCPLVSLQRLYDELDVYRVVREESHESQYFSFGMFLLEQLQHEWHGMMDLDRPSPRHHTSSPQSFFSLMGRNNNFCFLQPLFLRALAEHYGGFCHLPHRISLRVTEKTICNTNDLVVQNFGKICGAFSSITFVDVKLEGIVCDDVMSKFQSKFDRLLAERKARQHMEEREQLEIQRKAKIAEEMRRAELLKFSGVIDRSELSIPSKRKGLGLRPEVVAVSNVEVDGPTFAEVLEKKARSKEESMDVKKFKKGQKFKKLF